MTTILLTGATDGIGLALAHRYKEQKARLVLVGRRALSTLTDPIFTDATYCQIDLADENCTAELSAWLHEHGISELDLVIHNAAIGYVGALSTQPLGGLRAMIQVNLWTPIALSHMLFPLVERTRGKIAFISSVATALPGPNYATYTATKVALEGFVRSWQVELHADASPVQLQIIRPGATRTNMHAKSGADPAKLGVTRFAPVEVVAGQICAALERHMRATTVGRTNRIIYPVARWSDGLVDAILRRARRRGQGSVKANAIQNTRRHCLITGAADGIGRALAETLAAAGYSITAIDVDQERSAQAEAALRAAGYDVTFITADLAALEKLPILLEALATRPEIDLLIHNAGISAVGPFITSNLARQRAVLDINFSAPLLLTTALLAAGQLTSGATFVFISSLSYFTSYPGATVYAATKDGIAGYARSLGVALAAEGAHVLTVFPGPTRTAHARRYSPDNRREMRRMPPEQLATYIVNAIQNKVRVLVPGASNRGAVLLGKVLPAIAEQLMRRTIYDKLSRK